MGRATDAEDPGERINWWLLAAHVVAFCAAAVIGGILVYPSYPRFRADTDTAGEAFGAFLTCCVIAGGIGSLAVLCLSGAYRFAVRMNRKSAAARRR